MTFTHSQKVLPNIVRNIFIKYDGSLHLGLGKRRATRHLKAESPYFSIPNVFSDHLSLLKWFQSFYHSNTKICIFIMVIYITQPKINAMKFRNYFMYKLRLPLKIYIKGATALLYITTKESLESRALINFICHKSFVA